MVTLGHWVFRICVLGLVSCGQSASPTAWSSSASSGASGGSIAGADTMGGAAGTTAGGASGTTGTATGGAGATAASAAGNGGASGAGTAGFAGMAGAPVDPELTRRYTWLECGIIPPDPELRRALWSLDIDATGTLLVTNQGVATAWRVTEPFEASVPLWTRGGEGAFNTDVSEDGTMVALSGDLRLVFDAVTGDSLPIPQPPPPEPIQEDEICIFTEYRFSPDGRFVAGKHYDSVVEVFDTADFTLVTELETNGCGQGLHFGHGYVTTPEGVFRTSDWTATTALSPRPETAGLPPECELYIEPRNGVGTSCCGGGGAAECTTTHNGTTLTGGRHPRFSSEGHWLIAAGTLLHTPSGDKRVLDTMATEALFAPNGDVIAGRTDGSVVRYCRSDP